MSLYRIVGRPPEAFHRPVLVTALDGWIDAGFGAAGAMEHLLGSVPTELLARFDADALVDHRARRPTVRIENGINAAGIEAVLEERCAHGDIDAVGIWARVPHYAAAMPYPAASAALVEGLAAATGLALDARELHAAATLAAGRIDHLIGNSEEHQAMVRQLEATIDAAENEPPLDPTNLPSGDEIAAELERFLRGEG